MRKVFAPEQNQLRHAKANAGHVRSLETELIRRVELAFVALGDARLGGEGADRANA